MGGLKFLARAVPVLFFLSLHCLAEGFVMQSGKTSRGPALLSYAVAGAANAPYVVLCPGGREVVPEKYKGGCELEAKHSSFYLFNLIPVSPPVNPYLAVHQAVQKREGDDLINAHYWNETHYLNLLGRIAVFKVRGDVIRYKKDAQ